LAVETEDAEGRPADPEAGAFRLVRIVRDPELLSGAR
jgi:hypothetical protein